MILASWSDTNFYVVSEDFNYTILGEVVLDDVIDPVILQHAVSKAIRRFPYFSIRLIVKNDEFITLPNMRPYQVVHSKGPLTLGSEEVNFHLSVVSYYDKSVYFHFSHCITDGIGRMPFTKTVLYYYLTEKTGIPLDAGDIYLSDSDIFPDEVGEPVSLREISKAQPTYFRTIGDAFKISEKHVISDHRRREYRFSVDESAFIALCKSFGASPNTLVSASLARLLWEMYPDISKNIVGNLCVNMRPALNNKHSHLLLLGNIPLHFSPEMKDIPPDELFQITKKSVREQTQPENIRYIVQKNISEFDKIRKIKTIERRKKIVSSCIHGKEGFLSPTFTLSYVGRNSFASLSPFIKAIYTSVDAIPDDAIMIEITCANDRLFFTWLQDFSDDIFVNAFIRKLNSHSISVDDLTSGDIRTPKILLPD